ncbi:MAG: hypothetical protein WD077_06295 [Bacteroidia bacterium]
MTKSSWIKTGTLVLILGLVAFIFFMGKNNPQSINDDTSTLVPPGMEDGHDHGEIENSASFVIEDHIAEVRSSLGSPGEELVKSASDIEEVNTRWVALAEAWDSAGHPIISGYYYQKAAEANSTEELWSNAANQYYLAEKTATGDTFNVLVDLSIHAYLKTLSINPDNLNAKADLAVAYIEGKDDVMKGVGLLKEIEQVDPHNQKMLFYLGVLSIQSQQYPKALERFETLVTLQPQNPFHYYYLGQVHLMMDNDKKAVSAFGQYRMLIQDPALKKEAARIINSIQNQ